MKSGKIPRQTLLIVDDEPEILSALKRLLRNEPYLILTAGSGTEALDVLRHHPAQVILADVHMPDMDGLAFVEQAREQLPDSIFLILSGDADEYQHQHWLCDHGIWHALPKPWKPDTLTKSLRDAFQLWESQSPAN